MIAAWVAMMVPYPAAVTMITAYSTKGQVGYAVPFGRGSTFSAMRWLAPGQPPRPSRASYKIASGEVDGKHWTLHAYVGPWGTCIDGAGFGVCQAVGLDRLGGGATATALFEALGDSPGTQKVGYNVIVAKPVVSYVIVHFKNAAPVRIQAIAAGGVKFVGFVSAPPGAATSWFAYSASGAELAAGRSSGHSG